MFALVVSSSCFFFLLAPLLAAGDFLFLFCEPEAKSVELSALFS